jgi:UDP-galactose transporter B1
VVLWVKCSSVSLYIPHTKNISELIRMPVYTLSTFGSLLLVTVTVTRKMLTMILSVVWFGHRLSPMQWVGVGLVFGGVFVEAQLSKQEKLAKDRAKKEEVKKSS